MDYNYLQELDRYFCEEYSDYVRISAIEGYKMPDMLTVGADGNIARRDSGLMRLNHQENCEALLAKFKKGLADTDFTFNFKFPSVRDRIRDRFRKITFAKYLPGVLKRCDTTAARAGELLDIEPRFWKMIVKGRLYPEKNTVMALALVCRMTARDVNNLFNICGFSVSPDNVRDVVFGYLISQKIFNEEMRDRCLREYAIDSIPIKRSGPFSESFPENA